MSYTVRDSPGEFSLLEKEAVLGGVTAQSAASLLIQPFPWVLHLKEQFLITVGLRLFKNAAPSVFSWLWLLPVLRQRP